MALNHSSPGHYRVHYSLPLPLMRAVVLFDLVPPFTAMSITTKIKNAYHIRNSGETKNWDPIENRTLYSGVASRHPSIGYPGHLWSLIQSKNRPRLFRPMYHNHLYESSIFVRNIYYITDKFVAYYAVNCDIITGTDHTSRTHISPGWSRLTTPMGVRVFCGEQTTRKSPLSEPIA